MISVELKRLNVLLKFNFTQTNATVYFVECPSDCLLLGHLSLKHWFYGFFRAPLTNVTPPEGKPMATSHHGKNEAA